ncbi:hypothetical protein PPERSA_09599 [Pseudocohnilembus persalinus]|uniref:Phox homologous domain n=1 Tax=Pseudocohnilembus persalinus TaxID=266149 RepID=A0A0V0QFK3_PSEPJ|nr:hypothetical protein PPERSA_09599 [Pseudocohnilembus persalinus]|eukprot:KRX00993.1 hypothetical protein PPERSA_09599 [Pseudocohnilembus persalinus]
MLLKVFPGKIIPPTDYNTRENSPYELQKRMKFMNSFANTLVEDKTLFYNPFTISFFGDDNKKWENTIKIMEKQGPKDKIKYNFEGQYPLKFSNEMYEYKEKLRNFLPKMEGNFNKLYLVSKQLQKDFENVQNTLNQISTCYKSLFEDINQFSGEIIEGQMNHKKLGDSYYINHQIFDGWAQYMQKTKHDIQSFTNLFKFSFEESKVYKDLVKSTEDSEKTFIQYLKLYQSDQQNNKKQHVSNKQKQDDQQYYLSLKHDMAYWLSYTYYEIQDKFQKKGEDNLRFISIFFKSQAQKINEFMQQWANDAQQYVNNPFPIPRDSLQKTQLFKHLQKQNSMKE